MQHSKVQSRLESIAAKEREPSKHPEDCADAIENGCVFKTEREVHFIMAAGLIAYRCLIITASSRSVLPLHLCVRVCVWHKYMTFV